jgi:hypothetical protein
MKYIVLIFSMVSTMVAMEQSEDVLANVHILPFYTDGSLPLNAIDEITALASQENSDVSYRDNESEGLICHDSNKRKNDKKDDKEVHQKSPILSYGTIPFKAVIDCGIGYTALSTVVLDSHFLHHHALKPMKKEPKKLCQVNNLMNMYYIIYMLHRVSGTVIEASVNSLYKEYKNNILPPKNIATMKAYQDQAKDLIKPNNFNISKLFGTDIHQLITYENRNFLHAYRPLKAHILEPLLHLLLYLFVFLQEDKATYVVNVLQQYKNDLLVKAAEANLKVNSAENIHKAFDQLIGSIASKADVYENLSCEGLTVSIQKRNIEKCFIIHNFLCALNQYVYELIAAPVLKEKSSRLFNIAVEGQKKRKIINPNSFFEKHKQAVGIAKTIAVAVLISALLYRFIKNDKKREISLF